MNENINIDGNGNIVIQDIDGSNIIINPDNSAELRKLIIDFGTKLKDLPIEVLKMIEDKQDINSEVIGGANIYLTTTAVLHEIQQYREIRFGLTITNLTKEHRYFNQPTFQVFPKFDLKGGAKHDTFVMFPEGNIQFPIRLEYGEPKTLSFRLKPGFIEMCKELLEKDDNAYIQTFVSTTVGELYESKQLTMKKLMDNLKWINS